MRTLKALALLAITSCGFVATIPSTSARTYDECISDEKKKLEYAFPGEGSRFIEDNAAALCGGRPKERGANYQPSKKRAQKLMQDSCMSVKKKGFRCD